MRHVNNYAINLMCLYFIINTIYNVLNSADFYIHFSNVFILRQIQKVVNTVQVALAGVLEHQCVFQSISIRLHFCSVPSL